MACRLWQEWKGDGEEAALETVDEGGAGAAGSASDDEDDEGDDEDGEKDSEDEDEDEAEGDDDDDDDDDSGGEEPSKEERDLFSLSLRERQKRIKVHIVLTLLSETQSRHQGEKDLFAVSLRGLVVYRHVQWDSSVVLLFCDFTSAAVCVSLAATARHAGFG